MSNPSSLNIVLKQPQYALADFESRRQGILDLWDKNYLEHASHQSNFTLMLLPELALCGYPLQDLCLQKSFIQAYLKNLALLEKAMMQKTACQQLTLLLGGLEYELDQHQLPLHIYNVIYQLNAGSPLKVIYRKMLLPNYDIFDEKKYFTAGKTPALLSWHHFKIGLQICEDMWPGTSHDLDPTKLLEQLCQQNNVSLDLIINLSASPYAIHKHPLRVQRATEISHLFQAPFCYLNQVAAVDEILFDGQSFIQNGATTELQLSAFREHELKWSLKPYSTTPAMTPSLAPATIQFTNIYDPDITENQQFFHPILKKWSEADCEEVLKALQFGVQEYATRNNLKKFLIGLSGGIDSGLLATVMALCLKPDQSLELIYMPGQFSSDLSLKLCQDLCQKIQIPLQHLPIRFLHAVAKNMFKDQLHSELTGLSDENIQSRMRGMLLYARSNQSGAMVLNTSNKSELAVGYSTLYGDSVGALSVLGDLLKSQVYWLSDYINKKFGSLIPQAMIERAPTAELRTDQKDSDSLPDYPTLDPLLECFLSNRYTDQDLVELGFAAADVKRVIELHIGSEYKRFQFAPILKIRAKSFGFGHRIPLCKKSNFYHTL